MMEAGVCLRPEGVPVTETVRRRVGRDGLIGPVVDFLVGEKTVTEQVERVEGGLTLEEWDMVGLVQEETNRLEKREMMKQKAEMRRMNV